MRSCHCSEATPQKTLPLFVFGNLRRTAHVRGHLHVQTSTQLLQRRSIAPPELREVGQLVRVEDDVSVDLAGIADKVDLCHEVVEEQLHVPHFLPGKQARLPRSRNVGDDGRVPGKGVQHRLLAHVEGDVGAEVVLDQQLHQGSRLLLHLRGLSVNVTQSVIDSRVTDTHVARDHALCAATPS